MQHVHNLQFTCMFDLFECNFKIQYVGYARKYVHPKIGPDAAKVLQVNNIIILFQRPVLECLCNIGCL